MLSVCLLTVNLVAFNPSTSSIPLDPLLTPSFSLYPSSPVSGLSLYTLLPLIIILQSFSPLLISLILSFNSFFHSCHLFHQDSSYIFYSHLFSIYIFHSFHTFPFPPSPPPLRPGSLYMYACMVKYPDVYKLKMQLPGLIQFKIGIFSRRHLHRLVYEWCHMCASRDNRSQLYLCQWIYRVSLRYFRLASDFSKQHCLVKEVTKLQLLVSLELIAKLIPLIFILELILSYSVRK